MVLDEKVGIRLGRKRIFTNGQTDEIIPAGLGGD